MDDYFLCFSVFLKGEHGFFLYQRGKKKGFKRKKWEKVFKILFGNNCHLLMSVSIPSFLPPLLEVCSDVYK